jgi:hypothetical protein
MGAATFGGVFDIFTIGIVFVPLVGFCAVFGLVGGILHRRFFAAFMAILSWPRWGARSHRAYRW